MSTFKHLIPININPSIQMQIGGLLRYSTNYYRYRFTIINRCFTWIYIFTNTKQF